MSANLPDVENGVTPLTAFSDEERMFQATVRDFAEEQIRPHVARMDREGKMEPELIRKCFELGLIETMIGRLRFRIVGDLPLLEAKVRPLEGVHAFAKRTFDLAIAVPLLLLTSPILVIAVLLIAATSAGGVFYRQTRIGKDGCPFELWKLRTMRRGAEGDTGAVLASRGDPRITPVGRILRAARIDEIPQLWNVAKGDMSLVGPRPERPEFTEPLGRAVPGYSLRHAVRPGLTGLAQVSGGYSTEPEIKLRYDLAYLNNWSLGLDLSILLRTLPVILTRRGV